MNLMKFDKIKWLVLTLFPVIAVLLVAVTPIKNVQAEFSAKMFQPLNARLASLPQAAGQNIPLRLASGEFDPLFELKPAFVNERFTIKSYLAGQPGFYLVQFKSPVKTGDKKALQKAGARIYDYIPDFAFIVKMDETARRTVAALECVRWVGIYQPAYRVAPRIQRTLATTPVVKTEEFVVALFPGENLQTIAFEIQAGGGEIIETAGGSHPKIKARLTPSAIESTAAVNGVQWIESAPQWKLFNNQAAEIMTVTDIRQNHGLFGSGQIVAVADTGLDQGSPSPAQLHDDFENGAGSTRVLQIYDWVGDGTSDVNSGHGTHVAGSVLGNGFRSGANPAAHQYFGSYSGMAPEASLVFQSIENNATGSLSGLPLDLGDLFLQAYNANARIHTNSWGDDTAGAYTTDAADVDQFMWDHKNFSILFAAGNAGTDANRDGIIDLYSVGSPATAKNCITVGAGENNRPSGFGRNANYSYWAADYPVAPIYSDHISNNINGMAAFSSRGPCLDGRFKPDIVAPGTNIASTRSSVASSTMWGLLGLIPAHQSYYTFAGGTSMATPLTAGAASLVRQYYTDVKSITPSAALIKATLLNGALDMTPGQYGSGAFKEMAARPNNVEGWGRVDITNSLFPISHQINYNDQSAGLATGVTHTYNFSIADNTEPLKITLAWTDYPGTPVADGGLVNDLDLTLVDPAGTPYYPLNANHKKNNILASHDGSVDNGWTFNATGIGAAVKFTPLSPAVINAVRIYYATNTAQTSVVLNIWDDDGPGGLPGSSLFSQTVTPPAVPAGYYSEYTIGVPGINITAGSFYVELRSTQASNNPYLMIDETTPQGTSYVFNDSWLPLPQDDITGNWMIEAIVNQTGAGVFDRVNNVEGIDIASPAAGTYTLYVFGYNVPSGPQPYALVISGGMIAPPTNLQAVAVSPTRVDLTWMDNSTNETGFRVERKTGAGGIYAQIGPLLAQNTITFSDTTTINGPTYYYRVIAYNADGDAPSNEVNITTGVPTTPSGVTTTSVTSSRVSLHWTDNASGETGFRVERSLETGAAAVWESRGTTAENVVDFNDNCSSGTTYYYRVFAYNSLGDSAASNEVMAVTPAGSSMGPGGGGGGGGGGCFISASAQDGHSHGIAKTGIFKGAIPCSVLFGVFGLFVFHLTGRQLPKK